MKNAYKLIWIIALITIIGFSFAACDNGSTGGSGGGGGSGNFANTNWRSSYPYGGLTTMEVRLSFITSGDWALYMNNMTAWQQIVAGTYTVSGSTATLMVSSIGEYGKATISGNTLTLIGQLASYGGSSWTRENGDSGGNTGGGSSGSTGTLIIQNSPTGGMVYVYDSGAPTTYMEFSEATRNNIAFGINTSDRFTYQLMYPGTSEAFSGTGSYLVVFYRSGGSFYFKGNVSFSNGSATVDFNSMTSVDSLPY